jgi:hypothetical protein
VKTGASKPKGGSKPATKAARKQSFVSKKPKYL